ncbi:hypothetical protein HanPI659440_Chr09g0320801 [Helianthus annuus]|nr:hypothetical protein HanPI659440_Chr09g0320801 [Helianthus annuus]
MDDNKNKFIEDLGSATENVEQRISEFEENLSSGFSSSDSDSSDSEYNEWEERILEQNRQLDDILIELLISMANGDHGSTIKRPTRRDAAKRKRKRKGSASEEIAAQLRAIRLIRESENELMRKRLELNQQKEQHKKEMEQKKKEWTLRKMQLLELNTLLKKENELLSPEEENRKHYLMSKFYGI